MIGSPRRPAGSRAGALAALALGIGIAARLPVAAAVPGEVAELSWCAGAKDCLAWTVEPGAAGYNLYRGEAVALPALLDASADACLLGSFSAATSGPIVADPPAGALHWLLVTAHNADGEGSAGQATAGPRIVDPVGPCGGTGGLVINEVDYDQPGTDLGEFVEVFNGGSTARDLTSLVVILVNGQNSQEYLRASLSAAGPSLAPGAYLVVGSADVVAALPPGTPAVTLPAASNNIQNGAPDGVALFDTASGTLLDALSYEGTITAAQFQGVAGTYDLVEGTAATAEDSNASVGSLARFPNGSDTDEADTDWRFNNVPSAGAENPIP